MKKKFSVLVEKDEDGYFVATVPTFPDATHKQEAWTISWKEQKKRSRLISKLILDQDEFCLRVSMKIKAIRLTIKRSFSDLLDELGEPEAKEDIDFILGSMRQRRFEISSYHYHKAD